MMEMFFTWFENISNSEPEAGRCLDYSETAVPVASSRNGRMDGCLKKTEDG